MPHNIKLIEKWKICCLELTLNDYKFQGGGLISLFNLRQQLLLLLTMQRIVATHKFRFLSEEILYGIRFPLRLQCNNMSFYHNINNQMESKS